MRAVLQLLKETKSKKDDDECHTGSNTEQHPPGGLTTQHSPFGAVEFPQQERQPFIDEEGARNEEVVSISDDIHDEPKREDDSRVGLNSDTFSFLISAHPCSIPFLTGILAFALKNVIFYLIMVNLINYNDSFNRLGIPVSVAPEVLFSQILAFGISVFTQNDLVTGMVLLYQGHSKDMKAVYANPDDVAGGGGRLSQWLFAVSCLFLDGLFGLVVTFMLIVTSSDVLSVMLNFAAVEFVAGLDEAVFSLCEMGFLGRINKLEAALVADATYLAKRRHGSKVLHTVGLVGILAVVLSFWVYLFSLQVRGVYSPNTLIVQFDDQVRPELAAHSGLYVLRTNRQAGPSNRFQYDEQRTGGGHFGYCSMNTEWTFSVGFPIDPCDYTNVLAKSIGTQTYDMTQVAGDTWSVFRGSVDQAIPMQDFFMAIACETSDDCSGGRGDCIRNRCECQEGTFGLRCEHDVNVVCPEIRLDARFETRFPASRPISTVFQHIPNTFVYNRPVYVNTTTNDTIVFTGVRWAVTNFDGLNVSGVGELASLEEQGEFQALNIRSVDLLSDPVLFQTPDDRETTPVGVNWWVVPNRGSLSTAQLVAPLNPPVLLCSTCSPNNPCSFNNECVDGTCRCSNGPTGVLCQIPPLSDGKCDLFFNSPEFAYDGGDCCQATCVGTLDNQCGVVAVGSIPAIDIGFPHCIDPGVVGRCSSLPNKMACLIRNSQPLRSIAPGTSFPTLSANGRILVLVEPALSIVRVFDLVGSGWVQRGRTLRGTGSFGKHVTISTPPATVINDATTKIPVVLVVSGSKFRMFRWSASLSDWVEEQVNDYPSWGITRLELVTDLTNVPRSSGRVSTTRLLIDVEQTYSVATSGADFVYNFNNDPTVEIYENTGNSSNALVHNVTYPSSVGALSENGNFLVRTDSTGGPRITLSDLWNNETSEIGVPGVTSQDEIIAMGPVVVNQTSRYHSVSSEALGLSIVVSTGMDESGTQRLAIRYFTVERANRTFTLSMRAAEETVMNVSKVVFSSDGLSFLLVSAQNGILSSRPFVLDTSRTRWLQAADTESSFAFTTSSAEALTAGVPVSISSGNGRIRVVDGSSGVLQVMESAAMCSSDEITFRLVMAPDTSAGSIDWSIFEYGSYQGYIFPRNVLRTCTKCYNNPNISRTMLVEEVCVPRRLVSCIALRISASFSRDANGFAAYLIDGNNSTLLATDGGFGVSGKNYLSGGACEVDVVPADCPFPLVIAYFLSSQIQGTFGYEMQYGPRPQMFFASGPVLDGRGPSGTMQGSNVDVICHTDPNCTTVAFRDVNPGPAGIDLRTNFGDYAVFSNGMKIFGGAWEPALVDFKWFGFGC